MSDVAKNVLVHQHARQKRDVVVMPGTLIESTGDKPRRIRTKDGKEYQVVKLDDLLKELRKEGAKNVRRTEA